MPLLLTLLALVALSASIAYWVLQLYKPDQRPLAAVPVAALPEPAVDAAATLFGGQAMTAVVSNYQLTGVVAAGRNSVAILVADGQPAKAFPIGKELSAGVVVKEVHPRYVMLSEGGVLKRIDLAVDARPASEMAAPLPMDAPAPPAYPQQGQPMPQQQQMPAQPRPMPQSAAPGEQQQELDEQNEPPQGPDQEPPPPVPMARPVDGVTTPPPPAPPVQMPPATRNIGAPPVTQ
ncbi:type II secretion system protein N [Massilia soli]|nr:type II secretion system protein N [Massilia soli]